MTEKLQIEHNCFGSYGTNSFLFKRSNRRKEFVIIECPPGSYKGYKHLLGNKLHVLITHGHWDHVKDAHLFQKNGAQIYVHWRDFKSFMQKDRKKAKRILRNKKLTFLKDGDILDLLGERFHVIHTPGHTSGSVCFYLKRLKMLFSGDTLFKESVGRTDLKCGSCSFSKLKKSITIKLYGNLDEDVHVCPGHGEFSTIGHEKFNNPYVKIKNQ